MLVIEAKSTRLDVLEALPQALTHMLGTPQQEPAYGLWVNGREFVFVKLVHQPTSKSPVYGHSYALSLEREGDLTQVLAGLKSVGDALLS